MKLKGIKQIVFILVAFFAFSMTSVFAAGSATLSINGNSSANVNDNLALTLNVNNISSDGGGIVSIGGTIRFDPEYLQYVSSSSTAPYDIQKQEGNVGSGTLKIAGIDNSMSNGITSNLNVFTITFKVLKEGSTTVNFENGELADMDAILNATFGSKTITLNAATTKPTTAPKSSDATLKQLSIADYSISPVFSKNTTSYTLSVPNDVTSISVSAAATDTKATVSGTGTKQLNVGANSIQVVVTAENGTRKTYTINVTRANAPTTQPPGNQNPPVTSSNVATLSSLAVSGYNILPEFSEDVTNYTLSVPNDAENIILSAIATDTKASVSGTGTKKLSVGENEIKVIVTAEDGTNKIYTINVTRAEQEDQPAPEKSKDATLKSITTSAGNLSPAFKEDETNYTLSVPNDVTSIDVSAIANDEKATVLVTGADNLKEGVNAVKVTVTAEDGTTKVYILNVTRESTPTTTKPGQTNTQPQTTAKKSSNNYLKTLSTLSGDLNPSFKNTISNYNITVPYSVDKLNLNTITENNKAKVYVNGNENFKVGTVNVVEIEVVAEDGSSRVYVLNVTRSAKNAETQLKEIKIDGGKVTLNPTFSPDIYEYNINVDPKEKSLNISAIPVNSNSKVEIIGSNNLEEGKNVILIKVTDENDFVQYYTINATKTKKSGAIFGMDFPTWLIILLLILVLFLILLLLLIKKKNDNIKQNVPSSSPTIEFKPEFNINSRNGTDDDTVYSGGVLNQSASTFDKTRQIDINKVYESLKGGTNPKVIDYDSENKEVPYDPYDEIVTKDELIDAIEGNDVKTLKILYAQEMLNREKEKLKEEKTKEQEFDNDKEN